MNCLLRSSGVAVCALLFHLAVSPGGFAADGKVRPRAVPLPAAMPANSPDGGLQVPVLGYVSRSSPVELRPILGISGAALLGDAIALPGNVTALALAPGQEYAVAQMGDQGEVDILPLGADGLGAAAAVALYSSRRQAIQVAGGLPASPQVRREVDVSGLGAPGAFAVSDDGQALLVASPDATGCVLTLFPADGGARVVAHAGGISAIRFLAGATDAVATDPVWNQVLLLAAGPGGPPGGAHSGPQVIAGEADGVSTPVDAVSSALGRRVLVINQGNQTLLDVDLDAATTAAVPCPFAPAGIRMLRQKSSFWLTDGPGGQPGGLPGGAVWAVHTDLAPERVSLIPALPHVESVQ